ncbi:PEP-CTERM sorting domain-containing protein [Sphingomonas antarctica]|uniref:PEPxxWA-CTERM sorting domain-containing protein n=1 Tax=Sphingomonas antarctica TaxID=2040274 RepID=UPI0039E7CFC3
MKKAHLLAAVAAATLATSANALTLVSAAVFGVGGQTVWRTLNAPGTSPSNYALFVSNPGLGDFLNPHDEALNYNVTAGTNYAFLDGDGFPDNNTLNSDLQYRLELNFDNGATLTGTYIPGTPNSFMGSTPVTIGNSTLTLNEFSYTRSLANTVGQHDATPQTGNGNDYAGNFRFTNVVTPGAVPEPASWALMLGGFGLMGAGVRRRRPQVTVTYA